MKKTENALLEEIQKLTQQELNYSRDLSLGAEFFSLAIPIKGYEHLFFMIDSLLSVCQRALVGEYTPEGREANLDIATTLELVQGLMPQGEGQYLDRMRELCPEEDLEE